MRRSILVPTLTFAFLLAAATPALADPGKGSGQASFPMVCDGRVSTLTVGGGLWAAAHVHETGRTFIPRATHFYVEDADTGELLFEEHDVKNAAAKGSSSVCVDELYVDGMHFTFIVEGELK